MELPNQSPLPPEQSTPASPKKGSCNRNLLLGCGGLVLLVVLGIGGWFSFDLWQANNLLASAQENQAAGNYAQAVADLETLTEEYRSFDAAREGVELLPQVRLEWAESLREAGEYEEALERYAEVRDPELAEDVTAGQHTTRIAWGEALTEEGDYAAAQEQLEEVITETEQGEPAYDEARAALPAVYVGLAGEALEAGDVATAFTRLAFVLENYQTGGGRDLALASFNEMVEPILNQAQQERSNGEFAAAEDKLVAIVNYAEDTPQAEQVRAELPAFYLEWGEAAVAAEAFDEAAGVLEFLVENFPDSELTPQAQALLIDAQVEAVAQSGEAGELPPPQASGSSGGEQAAYDIANDTICPIEILLSGPQSQSVKLAPESNEQIEVIAGTYNLVARIDETQELISDCQNVIPFQNQTNFDPGTIYQSSFFIETSSE